MINLPRFITFTGADEYTDIKAMNELSRRYPIEWGILFSANQQGKGKYPPLEFVETVIEKHESRTQIAAHICGRYSRDLAERLSMGDLMDHMVRNFDRMQVNIGEDQMNLVDLYHYSGSIGVVPILQSRDETKFPDTDSIRWLYDRSGGNGVAPSRWPTHNSNRLVGFAGGHKPSNVVDHLDAINAKGPYWIDMEAGVRDENDRFSIDLCEQVCQQVYGYDYNPVRARKGYVGSM